MAEPEQFPGRAVLFRLDFGGARGWGHLVRCGALAAELGRRAWRCDLWTASDPTAVPAELRNPFAQVRPFRSTDGVPGGYRWLVVDHYGATDELLRSWRRSHPGKLLVIDDEARRRLVAADLVLNSRPGIEAQTYPEGIATLLGERFALIRSDLQRPLRPEWTPPSGTIPILVLLGGTDPAGVTSVVLEALGDVDAGNLVPVVVRPGVASDPERETAALKRFHSAVCHGALDVRRLAGWAACCRLAISAAGGTLFELAALGLPFVSVVVAGNQREFAVQVERRWGMPSVQNGPALRTELARAVSRALGDLNRQRPPLPVDFCGAQRVADAMGA